MKSKQIQSMTRATRMQSKPFRHGLLKAAVVGSLALIAAAWLSLSACSTATPPPAPEGQSTAAYQKGVPGGVIVNTVDVSARVAAIDKANRKVTLLGPDGEKFTVKVGPEAVNFDQIQKGDLVKAQVTEELVVYLEEEGGASGSREAAVVALAPKGAKPGGLVAQTKQITATVVAIDRTKRTATLRFEDGATKTFPVRADIDLTRHKTGEKTRMKKIAIGGVILFLALFLYLGFTIFFTWLFKEVATGQLANSPTPAPTFTPVPIFTAPIIAAVTPETATPVPTTTPMPTPTSTPVPQTTPTDLPTAPPTDTPAPAQPQVVSSVTVNVRSGPGTNYPVLTALPPGVPVPVTGRNERHLGPSPGTGKRP